MKTKIFVSTLLIAVTSASFAQDGWPEMKMKTKSLYERMGGIHKIAQMARISVELEMKDPVLQMNAKFKAAYESAPAPIVAFNLTNYLASSLGGPQKLGTMNLASVVKGFGFTKEQNERAWMLRMQAMTKAGIPVEVQKEARMWFDREVSKASPMMPMQEKVMNSDSLYARLGGYAPISMVVNDFVDQLATDPVILSNKNTVMSLTSGKVSADGIKYLVTEQLAEAAGGPFKYSGRTMASSHKGLMISDKEWAAAAQILKRVLDTYKVPQKEQGEIFSVISSTKRDIVDK